MRQTRITATTLTLAAALLGGSALAPAPAAAQGLDTDERSRFVNPPGGETFYRRGEDERLSAPWGGPGRDPLARNRGVTRSQDMNQDVTGSGTRMSGDPYDYGYRAGRDAERSARGMSEGREQRAAMELLDHARMQIDRGNLRQAWIALGQAETRLLTRSLPEDSSGEAATGAAIGAIREARQALVDREARRARDRTARALDLAARGDVVGRNVSGSRLAPAGRAGADQPLGSRDMTTGSN